MSITILFKVFEILMLIKSIISINFKVIDKNTSYLPKINNNSMDLKFNLEQENLRTNNLINKILKIEEKNIFLLDMNNILKFEATKTYLNNKLKSIKEKNDVEFFIFLFKNFQKFIENGFKEKSRKRNRLLKNIDKETDNNNYYLKKGLEIYKNDKKTNSNDKFFDKKKNYKNINLSSLKMPFNFTIDNLIKNTHTKFGEKSMNINFEGPANQNNLKENYILNNIKKYNTDFYFKEFLYINNLENSENSIIILISEEDFMIKIFLGRRLLKLFSYHHQRTIAENFLLNIYENNTEFALDELIDNMNQILNSNFSNKKLIIIFIILFLFIFLLIIFNLFFKNFYQSTNNISKKKKNHQEHISYNLDIIKEITKNNSIKKDCKEYDENNCMICLEQIYNSNCDNNSQENNHPQNQVLNQKQMEVEIYMKIDNLSRINIPSNIKNNSNKLLKSNSFISTNQLYTSYYNKDFSNKNCYYFKINKSLDDSFLLENYENSKNSSPEKRSPIFSLNQHDAFDKNNNSDDKDKNDSNRIKVCSLFTHNDVNNISLDKNLKNIPTSIDKLEIDKSEKEELNTNVFELKSSSEDQIHFPSMFSLDIQKNSIFECNKINYNNFDKNFQKFLNNQKENEAMINNSNSNQEIDKIRMNEKVNFQDFTAILDCNHRFHAQCIALWMTKGEYCPICRNPIKINNHKIPNNTENFAYLETNRSGDSISLNIS